MKLLFNNKFVEKICRRKVIFVAPNIFEKTKVLLCIDIIFLAEMSICLRTDWLYRAFVYGAFNIPCLVKKNTSIGLKGQPYTLKISIDFKTRLSVNSKIYTIIRIHSSCLKVKVR